MNNYKKLDEYHEMLEYIETKNNLSRKNADTVIKNMIKNKAYSLNDDYMAAFWEIYESNVWR